MQIFPLFFWRIAQLWKMFNTSKGMYGATTSALNRFKSHDYKDTEWSWKTANSFVFPNFVKLSQKKNWYQGLLLTLTNPGPGNILHIEWLLTEDLIPDLLVWFSHHSEWTTTLIQQSIFVIFHKNMKQKCRNSLKRVITRIKCKQQYLSHVLRHWFPFFL